MTFNYRASRWLANRFESLLDPPICIRVGRRFRITGIHEAVKKEKLKMEERKKSGGATDRFRGTSAAKGEEGSVAPVINKQNRPESGPAPNILEQAPSGSGAAATRSSKGGKSGGGMGGQQAGGIKGGGKRKTHAGRK
jgi:hypothetical protein